MKIPLPSFIKRFFEAPAVETCKLDVTCVETSDTPAPQAEHSVITSSVGRKPSGTCYQEQETAEWKHMPTPISETCSFRKQVTFSQDPLLQHLQESRSPFNSWAHSVLATPMVLSCLGSLETVSTPANAFPDILEIIDQPSSCDSLFNGSSQADSISDSDLMEVLIAIAEQKELEKNVSSTSFLYTRPEDVLLSRRSGKKKCHHAKRMTEDEQKYFKKMNTAKRRKQTSLPLQGMRRSARTKKQVHYF